MKGYTCDRYITETGFTTKNGDRDEFYNIAIVITDGGSNDKRATFNAAREAKKVCYHTRTNAFLLVCQLQDLDKKKPH